MVVKTIVIRVQARRDIDLSARRYELTARFGKGVDTNLSEAPTWVSVLRRETSSLAPHEICKPASHE